MHFFSQIKYPAWLLDTYQLGSKLRLKRSMLGSTFLRLLLVLTGCLPFAAVLALTDIYFWEYADTIRSILPTTFLQKLVPLAVWTLVLSIYAIMSAKYRGKLNEKTFPPSPY